jgi:hypothetical protein
MHAMNNTVPVALERLDDQIRWYGRKSESAQTWFKALKIAQLLTAGAIPLVSIFAIAGPEKITASLGLAVLLIEGLQQLNQFQANWISYRMMSETLRQERFLFEAKAGPYSKSERPLELLAERVEGLIAREHGKWIAAQQEPAKARTQKQ